MLWDYQWQIVLFPIICAIAGIGESLFIPQIFLSLSISVMKIMQILSDFRSLLDLDIDKNEAFAPQIDWTLMYIVLSLTTTVICTVLIVYRIVHFAHRILLFRSIISALIESSAIYTLALIVYLGLVGRNMMAGYYADVVGAYIRVKTYLN